VSIDALLTLVGRQADAEAEALLTAAGGRARAIAAAADAELAVRRARELSRLETASRQAIACATAAAERAHRESWLRERDRVLAQVFDGARGILAATPPARYERSLAPAVEAALRYLEGVPAVLRCRPEVAAQLERLVAQRPGVKVVVDASAAAGVLAEASDGSVVIDNTLDARLARSRRRLAIVLAARLEAGDPQ